MTTTEANPARIFADARRMYEAALVRMADDDIRDAAEKAWCAAKRAVDGLVFARTGEEPSTSSGTSKGLRTMVSADPAMRAVRQQYMDLQAVLHGECFYYGFCDPIDETERLIRGTAAFIQHAESLAQN